MGFQGNDSSVQTSNVRALKQGFCNVSIIAINPTLAELNQMGINTSKEQEYITQDNDGNTQIKLDFWIENKDEKLKTKVSLWLTDKTLVSSNGKKQYVNAYGKTAWLESADAEVDWFINKDNREAKRGEESLYNLMSAYLNIYYNKAKKQYQDCRLDDIDALFKGNYKELTDAINSNPNAQMRVLLGARQSDSGKFYQTAYSYHFERVSSAPWMDGWIKSLDYSYTEFKAEYDRTDFNLKDYVPALPADKTEDKSSDAFGSASDDSPF